MKGKKSVSGTNTLSSRLVLKGKNSGMKECTPQKIYQKSENLLRTVTPQLRCVSPSSVSTQAVECNPPVEEGDTVLYINGMSVAEKTHEEVIAMIKASKETLVIIIKPRDLSRSV